MSGTTWTKFFWADWESDPALRLCSFAAQGMWMRMLCIAAAHDPIGYVAVAGRALDETSLARMTGGLESEVRALVGELDRNGVFSRDRHGRVYSRRMVNDAKRAAIAKKNGKNGGNPNLRKDTENPPPVNPQVKTPLKTQEPEARNQTTYHINSASAPGRPELDQLEADLRQAAGPALGVSPKLMVVAPILGLLRPGDGPSCDLEADVLPAIRACSSKAKPGSVQTWAYFQGAIIAARDERLAGAGRGEAPPTQPPEEWSDDRWRAALAVNRETGQWGDRLGPRPGELGCRVPAHLIVRATEDSAA